jgi:hypothetical protein
VARHLLAALADQFDGEVDVLVADLEEVAHVTHRGLGLLLW